MPLEDGLIRKTLLQLRKAANLSQADLAKRLEFDASRISRIEDGKVDVDVEDAQQIAESIGTAAAIEFSGYLKHEWQILEKPAFTHLSRRSLWHAEQALQRLSSLESNPDIKNAFLQQIHSCRQALQRAADFLLSTEHPIAFIGSPGVGKTTVICSLAGLRRNLEETDHDLDRQMALQTGGGRQTMCEVHIRNGSEYGLVVEPCSEDELWHHINDFCDHLLKLSRGSSDDDAGEGPGISAEVERALRNMTGLKKSRGKDADGKEKREDLAVELAKLYPKREDLAVQVRLQLELFRRTRSSISFPRESSLTGIEWVARTAGEINYGRHPEFSLPRRIEINIPTRVLANEELDIRLIDTRGIDETSAPRRDLQAYLDDPRALLVLCSGFNDAPDAATLSIVERAVAGGLRQSLAQRGVALVLPHTGEDAALRDETSGERVTGPEEGREIKSDHIASTLLHHGLRGMPIAFLNVREQIDCDNLRKQLSSLIETIRDRQTKQIDVLVSTIDHLIDNKAVEETKAVFYAATKNLRNWFGAHMELPAAKMKVEDELLSDMDGLRYVASLRASVNRRGSWDNFDFWLGLGDGACQETVTRTADQLRSLKILIDAALRDLDVAAAHDFLRHFMGEVDSAVAVLYQEVRALGETAFLDQLGQDYKYWTDCQWRWGGGSGYKMDIRRWTKEWFSQETRRERREFIDAEIKRRWKEMLGMLEQQLVLAEPGAEEINDGRKGAIE